MNLIVLIVVVLVVLVLALYLVSLFPAPKEGPFQLYSLATPNGHTQSTLTTGQGF